MNKLEQRIREVAAKMEGKFFETVPHSVFVQWDQTWDCAEDLGITGDSTDEEIETAIRNQEATHDEYYSEEKGDYDEGLLVEEIAKESAPRIVKEAGAEGKYSVEEVEFTIKGILLSKVGRDDLKKDVWFRANELWCSAYGDANKVLNLKPVELEDLKRDGVDYGDLDALLTDGPDEIIPDLETAVRRGIVSGWATGFIKACKEINNK